MTTRSEAVTSLRGGPASVKAGVSPVTKIAYQMPSDVPDELGADYALLEEIQEVMEYCCREHGLVVESDHGKGCEECNAIVVAQKALDMVWERIWYRHFEAPSAGGS